MLRIVFSSLIILLCCSGTYSQIEIEYKIIQQQFDVPAVGLEYLIKDIFAQDTILIQGVIDSSGIIKESYTVDTIPPEARCGTLIFLSCEETHDVNLDYCYSTFEASIQDSFLRCDLSRDCSSYVRWQYLTRDSFSMEMIYEGQGTPKVLWSDGDTSFYRIGAYNVNYCYEFFDEYGCGWSGCEYRRPPKECNIEFRVTPTLDLGFINVDALIEGADPIAYKWSTGDSVLSVQVYESKWLSFTIRDTIGCSKTDSIFIDYDQFVEEQCYVTIKEDIVHDNMLGLIARSPFLNAASYTWNTGSTERILVPTESGEYCVTMNLRDICTAEACYTYQATKDCDLSLSTYPSRKGVYLQARFDTDYSTLTDYSWDNGDSGSEILVKSSGTYCVTATNSITQCSRNDCISVNLADIYANEECVLLINPTRKYGPFALEANTYGMSSSPPYWSTGDSTAVIFPTYPGRYCAYMDNCSNAVSECYDFSYHQDDCMASIFPTYNFDLEQYELQIVHPNHQSLDILWSTGETSSTINFANDSIYSVEVYDKNNECLTTLSGQFNDGSVQCYARMQAFYESNLDLWEVMVIPLNNDYQISWPDGSEGEVFQVKDSGIICAQVIDDNNCKMELCLDLEKLENCEVTLEKGVHPDGKNIVFLDSSIEPISIDWDDGSDEIWAYSAGGVMCCDYVLYSGCKGRLCVEATTQVKEIENKKKGFSIHPNPTLHNVLLDVSQLSGELQLRIYDINGKLIYLEESLSKNEEEIDLQSLDRGIYIMVISNQNGKWTEKLIKI